MALSGTFYGTTTNEWVKPKIVWSAVQDVAGNYSDVTATLYYSRTNSGFETAGTWAGSITINADTLEESKRLSITYNSDTQAITHTVRVYHDNYGAKSVSISATGGISISSMTATTISATVTLDTIARHTQIADATAQIGSTVNLVLTRKNGNFYHSLRYKNPVDGTYYYINANGDSVKTETLLSAVSVPFKVPDLYAAIPDSRSGTFTIECWTYPTGDPAVWLDDCTSAVFTYTVDASACAPAVSATVEDTNAVALSITGNSGVLIRHVSNARVTVSATAKCSATVKDPAKDVSVQAGGSWHYDSDLSFDFPAVEQSSFSLWVRDSRSYETYGTASAAGFVPYVKLTSNPYAKRLDQTGSSVVLTFTGRYYAGDIHNTPNVLQLWYQLEGQSGWTEVLQGDTGVSWSVDTENSTYAVQVRLEGLSYTKAFFVKTCVRDLLGQKDTSYDIYKDVTIPAGYPVFDWGEKDFAFHVPASGEFTGTFGGVHIRHAFIDGVNTLQIQTRYAQFDADYVSRQTIFLFGNASGKPFYGAVVVHGNGTVSWSGTQDVSIDALAGGKVRLDLPAKAWDDLVFLSAKAFEII